MLFNKRHKWRFSTMHRLYYWNVFDLSVGKRLTVTKGEQQAIFIRFGYWLIAFHKEYVGKDK